MREGKVAHLKCGLFGQSDKVELFTDLEELQGMITVLIKNNVWFEVEFKEAEKKD